MDVDRTVVRHVTPRRLACAASATLLVASLTVACGGGGGGSAPTAPSAPTPPPVAPAPAVPVVTFVPQTGTPVGRAMALMVATRGQEAGKIAIGVTVYNLPAFHKVRGEIRWNADLLEYDTWGKGEYFDHDGTDWTFFTGEGRVSLFLDYPSTQAARTGSGEVFLFRLKPKAGRTGSSQIVWNEPAVYTASFGSIALNNIYGGTITVQ